MELTYTIKRSKNRKKLSIIVERDCKVVVRAPENTSDEKIHEVIQSKHQWIYEKIKHSQKYREFPHAPGIELVNGESLLYLGRNYQIEVCDKTNEITFDNKFFVPKLYTSQNNTIFIDWYKSKAKQVIIPRANKQAKTMGVQFQNIKITSSKYQWGSCTKENNINFNWRLIKAPLFVIDYVITHELAHLIEPNHTSKFWNIVYSQHAKAREAKKWLLDNGQMLEETF